MSAGTQLAAEGEAFTLTNGHTVRVKYSMKSLLKLEESFGGLNQISLSADGNQPMIGPMLDLLTAGLLHEHDGAGAPLTRDRLTELLELDMFQDLVTIAGQALHQAFPTAKGAAAAPKADEESSPGPTGTTAPPSSSAVLMTTSGG